ncbi:MAG: PAS domain S-box protein, partial [Betaproteobacteria bacterium]
MPTNANPGPARRRRPCSFHTPLTVACLRLRARRRTILEGREGIVRSIKADLIRRTRQAAEASEIDPLRSGGLLEQVLDQSGEAIIVKDMDAVVTFWNREASSLYGFSAEEAIGRPLRALHAADLSEADYAKVLTRIRAGKPTSFTTERRKKNGEVVRVAIKTTPLTDARNAIVGEITVVRDITTLHRTEDALRGAQVELEAKLATIR